MKTVVWGMSKYAVLASPIVILGTPQPINVWLIVKSKNFSHRFKFLIAFASKTLQKS